MDSDPIRPDAIDLPPTQPIDISEIVRSLLAG
jgi:hypothetical protein